MWLHGFLNMQCRLELESFCGKKPPGIYLLFTKCVLELVSLGILTSRIKWNLTPVDHLRFNPHWVFNIRLQCLGEGGKHRCTTQPHCCKPVKLYLRLIAVVSGWGWIG